MTTHYADVEVDAVHEFAWRAIDGVSGAGSHNAAKVLLDKIAPAIAARALREFAAPLLSAAVADDDEACPDGMCGRCTQGNLAQLAILRADEIEATS